MNSGNVLDLADCNGHTVTRILHIESEGLLESYSVLGSGGLEHPMTWMQLYCCHFIVDIIINWLINESTMQIPRPCPSCKQD